MQESQAINNNNMSESDLIVKAQAAGGDGDEALYAGQWEIALEKYLLATSLCRDALPKADIRTQQMLQKLINRYSEKAQQIQEYIESTKSIFVNEEATEISNTPGFNEQVQESGSYLPFGLLHEEPAQQNPPENVQPGNGLWIFWQHVEKLLGLLPSPRQMIHFETNSEEHTENLESSFVVVPGDEEPNEDTQVLTIAQLKAENEQLKSANLNLIQQNAILRKMRLGSAGVQDLLQENTMLKRSISNFRQQVQRQTEIWHSTMIGRPENSKIQPHSTFSVINPNENQPEKQQNIAMNNRMIDERLTRRINDLETTTHNLYKKLEEKEKEIVELTKYKKRYEKIMSKAKKKRESHPITGDFNSSTSTSEIVDYPVY